MKEKNVTIRLTGVPESFLKGIWKSTNATERDENLKETKRTDEIELSFEKMLEIGHMEAAGLMATAISMYATINNWNEIAENARGDG